MNLTPITTRGYSDRVAPHCAIGFGRPESQSAQPRSSGFFVRTVQHSPRCGGLDGEPFGAAGSLCRSTNPVQPATLCLVAFGGGFSPIHKERTIMQAQAQNSPAIRVRNLDAIDTASARIAQATAFLDVMMLASTHDGAFMSPSTITNSLWGIRPLLEQASAAVGEV